MSPILQDFISRRLLNRFLTTSSIRMTGFVSSRQRISQRRRREELVQQQASEGHAVEKSAAEQHRRRTEVNSIITIITIVTVIISLALKPIQCVKNCIPRYNVNIARSIDCAYLRNYYLPSSFQEQGR